MPHFVRQLKHNYITHIVMMMTEPEFNPLNCTDEYIVRIGYDSDADENKLDAFCEIAIPSGVVLKSFGFSEEHLMKLQKELIGEYDIVLGLLEAEKDG